MNQEQFDAMPFGVSSIGSVLWVKLSDTVYYDLEGYLVRVEDGFLMHFSWIEPRTGLSKYPRK